MSNMKKEANLAKANLEIFLDALYEGLKIKPIDKRQLCVEVLGKEMIFEYNIPKMFDEIIEIEPGTSEEKIKEELLQYQNYDRGVCNKKDLLELEIKDSCFEGYVEQFINDRREIQTIIFERVDYYFNSCGESFDYIMNFIDTTKTPTEIEEDIANIMKNVLDSFISAEIDDWWELWYKNVREI